MNLKALMQKLETINSRQTLTESAEKEQTDKKKCPPMSHIKKMCQDGKSVAEICKMHPDCDHTELKQMIADCKETMDKDKKKTNEGIGFTSSIARSLIQEFGYKLDEAEEFQFSPEQEKFLGKANRQDPYILARMPGPKPPFSYFKDPEDQAIAKQMNFGANNLNKIKNLVGAGTQGDASTFAAPAPAKMRGGDPAAAQPAPAGAPELVGTQNQAPNAAAQADLIANRMDQEAGANTMGQTAAPAPTAATAAPVTTPAQRATAAAARARAAAKAGADASDPSTQTKPAAPAASTWKGQTDEFGGMEEPKAAVAPAAAAPAAAFNPGKDSQRANVTAISTELRAIADARDKLGPNVTMDNMQPLFDRLKKVKTDAAGAGEDVKSAVQAHITNVEAELKKVSGGAGAVPAAAAQSADGKPAVAKPAQPVVPPQGAEASAKFKAEKLARLKEITAKLQAATSASTKESRLSEAEKYAALRDRLLMIETRVDEGPVDFAKGLYNTGKGMYQAAKTAFSGAPVATGKLTKAGNPQMTSQSSKQFAKQLATLPASQRAAYTTAKVVKANPIKTTIGAGLGAAAVGGGAAYALSDNPGETPPVVPAAQTGTPTPAPAAPGEDIKTLTTEVDAIEKELMGDDGSAFQNDPEIQKAIADARAAAGGLAADPISKNALPKNESVDDELTRWLKIAHG